MRNLKAIVEYDGTDFHGFQIQVEERTVQGEIEAAIASVTQEKVRIIGAGRTDAGVHARGQVISFRSGWDRSVAELHRALNAVLPLDVAFSDLSQVPDDFHARFSAVSREYRYTVLNRPVRSPLERCYTYHVARRLDVDGMAQASKCLIGSHDFASFGQPTTGTVTVRNVHALDCIREGDLLSISIVANAFLYRMVRSIAGTLISVGHRALSPSDVEDILAAEDRGAAQSTAPARALCLIQVNYE